VKGLTEAKRMQTGLNPCDNKRKKRKEAWGSVLVERQRRNFNQGGSMLQKAMRLKQKKNLDTLRGNSFAALQFDTLNQISREVNIKIGHDNVENDKIIKNLIETEQRKCEEFLGDNLEIGLPTKINIDLAMTTSPLKVNGDIEEHSF
jgi:hypothetical protein